MGLVYVREREREGCRKEAAEIEGRERGRVEGEGGREKERKETKKKKKGGGGGGGKIDPICGMMVN